MRTNIDKFKPVISILLPVFNGGEYLKLSVASVLSQTINFFELLIIDDCSTDDSWKYIESIKDKRVTLYRNETNKGLFFNLNFLISQTKSGLIKLWSQDDVMYPGCLEAFIAFHQHHPGIGFSYSGRDIIDENGALKKNNFVDNTPALVSTQLHTLIAFFTGSIAGNIANVCISKTAFNKVGKFNEDMKISADFDMWVRLAKDHETGFIKEKLIQLRDHSGQLSRNETLYLNHVKEDIQVYRYLISYSSPAIIKEGRSLMRNHKLVFYYTLMVKALLKGNLKTFVGFYKQLSSFDNFVLLSYYFAKAKIIKPRQPDFS